jgi:hypothetical protein
VFPVWPYLLRLHLLRLHLLRLHLLRLHLPHQQNKAV